MASGPIPRDEAGNLDDARRIADTQFDVESESDVVVDDTPLSAAQRHASFFALSIAFHAALIAAVVMLVPAVQRPHNDWVLAYLLEFGNGGAGAGSGHHLDEKAAHTDRKSRVLRTAIITPHRVTGHERKAPARFVAKPATASSSIAPVSAEFTHDETTNAIASRASPSSAMTASRGGAGAEGVGDHPGPGGGTTGEGIGNGNPGDSLAHAGYGEDPPPPYPAHSRREGEQGTVTLHVLVASNGTVERVEIAQSSGFDALDDAAMVTVRERWRFVPARRGGTPAESWVLVPIRFALTEANADH